MTSFSILLSSVADVKDFVDTISRFRCEVDVLAGRYVVNAKSIMGVLSLGVGRGDTIHLIVSGEDEQKALAAMEALAEGELGGQ
mgnify:CR=1 FL=1